MSRFAQREILARHKAQEGRKTYPADDFSVGNPRRGFPYAKHKKPAIPAFFLFGTEFVRSTNILLIFFFIGASHLKTPGEGFQTFLRFADDKVFRSLR